MSEPVSDYFISLSNIRVQKSRFENTALNVIANEIEEKILKGKVEFNPQTKQLLYTPNETDLTLELSSASSMVSELAPIVSFLRYTLTLENKPRWKNSRESKAYHLIMIEEPEAHLHPEVQIMLMEIFSKLVKNNVKIILTSHSNYIFNKFNNLIMSKDLEPNKIQAAVFVKSNKGSKLDNLDINEDFVESDIQY